MKGLAKRNNKTRGKTLRRRKSRGKTARRRKTRGGGDDEENPRPEWLNEDNCKASIEGKETIGVPDDISKEYLQEMCRTQLKMQSNADIISSFLDKGEFKLNKGGKKRKTHKKRK
jgi:hypothetical protein